MPFPGGKIIGLGDGNHSREDIHPPHMDDSGEWHWLPILIGCLFLIVIVIFIICLVSNIIFCKERIKKIHFNKTDQEMCVYERYILL